jgi:uncharacterized protein (DUF983 family)
MNGNICPQCGKSVMSYKRFFREAEPYKIAKCDNCSTSLRRNKKVYLYLLLMIVLLCVIVLPAFDYFIKPHTSYWIIIPILIVVLGAWSVFINYLAWRIIGWDLLTEKKT